MKSLVVVLIDPESNRLRDDLSRNLEPYRLDDDDLESIRSRHWDYWFLPTGEPISDPEIEERFPNEDPEIRENSSVVGNLPKDFVCSGIISNELGWVDLQEYGWSLINEPCRANKKAMKQWTKRMREIFTEHSEKICVQVIVHC